MSRLNIIKQIEESVKIGTNLAQTLDEVSIRVIKDKGIPVRFASDFRHQLFDLCLKEHMKDRLLGRSVDIVIEKKYGNS